MALFVTDTPAAAAAAAAAPAPQAPAQQAPAQTHQAQNMQAMPGAGGMNPNLFNKMDEASSGSWNFAKAGRYLFRLDSFEMSNNRKLVPIFVGNFTCTHIFDVPEGSIGHRLGELVNTISNSTSDYFLRDVKKQICAAAGCADHEVGPAEAWEACGFDANGAPNNIKPLDGRYITIEVNNTVKISKSCPAGEEHDPQYQIVNINYHGARGQEDLLRILTPEAVQQFYTLSDGTCVLTPQA